MSTQFYAAWRTAVVANSASPPDYVKWADVAQTFRILPVGLSYNYNAAHTFLSDVPAAQRVGTGVVLSGRALATNPVTLGGQTYFSGRLRWNATAPVPVVFESPTGSIAQFVIYHDTGTESTSRLVAHLVAEAGGLSGVPQFSVPALALTGDLLLGLETASALVSWSALAQLLGASTPALDLTIPLVLHAWKNLGAGNVPPPGTNAPALQVPVGSQGSGVVTSGAWGALSWGAAASTTSVVCSNADEVKLWTLSATQVGGSNAVLADLFPVFYSDLAMPVTPPGDLTLDFVLASNLFKIGHP